MKNSIGIGIEINALSRSFATTKAIDSMTVSIEPGLLHGIIGPDGAGKTTLMRLLSGLLHPDSGTINFNSDGEHVPFKEISPSIAYMPSRMSLYPDLSIEEHLEFFKSLYELPENIYRSKSEQLLSITRLSNFKRRKVGQLSGGMYKKTGLMCALLRSPKALFLDEPTNGVDPISRREFWELLYGLAEEKILVLVSTAYMDEAERCARVHLLEEGNVFSSGAPSSLLDDANVKSFDELFLLRAGK